jgi:hypothetical protein
MLSTRLNWRSARLLCCLLALVVGSPAVWAFDDDIYGEGRWNKFEEGPAWKEQTVVLPPYPDEGELLEVDLDLGDFPFTFWIDPASLQVGEDRVVRYTGVLRSSTGVENVFYEGVRCSKKEYQRYAYGSGGVFKRLDNSTWRPVSSIGAERYRSVFMRDFLCPLPGFNREKQLLRRVKTPALRPDF